jgi:hypothetical protein
MGRAAARKDFRSDSADRISGDYTDRFSWDYTDYTDCHFSLVFVAVGLRSPRLATAKKEYPRNPA